MKAESKRAVPRVEVPLVLSGFERAVPRGTMNALAFGERDAAAWFESFVSHLCGSIRVRHLPVYRMADGEFIFAVGPRAPLPPPGAGLRDRVRYAAAVVRMALRRARGKDVQTCWGESYADRELQALRASYATQLREIAASGYLAVHLTRSRGRFAEEYIRSVCSWMAAKRIPLESSYVPFYFVYAALRGPTRSRLLRGRRVLVVTGATEERRRKLLEGLEREGAADGEVYAISPTRSMMEVLDLGRVRTPPDVVLVGAGIGSSNILTQLAPLRTVCIDAGICVDCLADPSQATRLFLAPDASGAVSAGRADRAG